ncbi:WD repeat and FYVE domain-containing protein [Xylariales sp. PMI_506]|nr:WD repeat and FYVE domain-containing protein [Xylariales sp. PMI_506]
MATRPSRYRSSTSASTPLSTSKAVEVLQKLLESISATLSIKLENGYPKINELTKQAAQVKQHLAAGPPPSSVQDDFRHLRGFYRLFEVLRAFSGFYDPQKRSEEDKISLFHLLDGVFGVLAAAFRGHPGNRRYFRIRVESGGWEALDQAIASIGLGGSGLDSWTSSRLFGKLLAFSLNEPAVDELCRTFTSQDTELRQEYVFVSSENGDGSKSLKDKGDDLIADVDRAVRSVVNPTSTLQNPEVIRTVIEFWISMPRGKETNNLLVSVLILKILTAIIGASDQNLSLVHNTGILSRLMDLAFDEESFLSEIENNIVLEICQALMFLGVRKLTDAQALLTNTSSKAASFCLDVTEKHRSPPFIQFDLSLHGHASIDLPSLGRPFPPQSSAGYTFAAWVRVDRFDPKTHTTIFGIFDATQTCFILLYLEKDTRNFILQTSVTSQRPSVRFKAYTFEPGQWYHIALVHRRPKTMTPSKASLYVDGEFVEQIRATYPSSPPLSNASTESFASFTSNNNKTKPVQAFMGTPRELSTHLGHGLVFSKWSLATAHLFDDVLSDELLAVPSRLGPRYQGNFQDCLGGFQTYEASAALGLRNDLVMAGREGSSDIIKVIREKASHVIPEQRILLSMMASSIFREKDSLGDSQLFRALSRGPANTLVQMTLKSGVGIAINTALPSVNDALIRSNGVAVLSGDPVVAVPQYIDDAMWRLAGFTPLALKMIDRASDAESILHATELVFRSVNSSWRNSEALEKDGGYSIIGMLLKAKLGFSASASGSDMITEPLMLESIERDKLSFQILSLVLEFVGYKHQDPLESVIINPLAYRILLLDFDGWRRCAPIIQELYYKQFVTFAVMSKYHQYNNRRLLRMRIVKRLLDALKGESLPRDVLPFFMTALENLVKCSYNTEVHRCLASFITYAFHTTLGSLPRTPRPPSALSKTRTQPMPRRPTSEINLPAYKGLPLLTRKHVGVRILEMYSQLLCEKGNVAIIRKFAKTVTNKWLLYLLSEDDPEIVVYGCKILARLLVSHGAAYTSKFSGKTGGFSIMAHRLKRWWDIPTLWPICFCILFGYDVAEFDFEKNFDFFSLIETFGKCKVVHPDALLIITSMLQHGLKDVLKNQDDPDSPSGDRTPPQLPDSATKTMPVRPRPRSMSLEQELETRQSNQSGRDRVVGNAAVLQAVIRFLSDLHTRSSDFRDFALTSEYIRYLLSALYPALVSTDAVSPETELNSRDSALTFEGGDVMIRPLAGSSAPAPIVRTNNASGATMPTSSNNIRGTPLQKASSFVLLTAQKVPPPPSSARLAHVMSPKKKVASQGVGNAALEGLLELVINVFIDQILIRKEFAGFGLFLKVPPGFQEHQAFFESYVLQRTILHLSNTIKLDWKLLSEPKVLTNMARFSLHMVEAIFEGWFMNGTESMLDFAGLLLEYLQKPEVAGLKTVRLCSQAVFTIRCSFLKLILLRLSEIDNPHTTDAAANFSMNKILYWQMVVLDSLSAEDDYMRLLWYQLYVNLVGSPEPVRIATVNIWRIMLVQKPDECATVFRQFTSPEQGQLIKEFKKLAELDNDTFITWVDEHRPSLDGLFLSGLSRIWEDFVVVENHRTSETAKSRLAKRRETLRKWQAEAAEQRNVILRHDMANSAWMKSIYSSEHFKHQRYMQDQQDDVAFYSSTFSKMKQDLTRPGAVFFKPTSTKWKLDRTEGRNRMRLRVLPDPSQNENYQPKRRATDSLPASSLRLTTSIAPAASASSISTTPTTAVDGKQQDSDDGEESKPGIETQSNEQGFEQSVAPDDDFEMVDDPNDPAEGDDGFEDKNRRVMRRLEPGDIVQQVYNISRIIGLEASEGILLVGKDALYIMDNFFQSSDGEIVNVWEAPQEERDPFSQIITGAKTGEKRLPKSGSQDSRSWRWHDVISLSKRRFLFRDVAIEVFFTDGRSYLLTAINQSTRDDIYNRLMGKTPHTAGANLLPNPEDAWRLESLKVFEEGTQGLGSKLGSIFNSSPWNPVIRRWQRGEISNFHYLMLLNTMAGRTFNDLTQYPVFPWILADYTSEELDLTNPATFRDLSKPMGVQTPSRQAEFAIRYQSLAEIGEQPFHYGTHYSSAMVVASYLIRLPPFVQSYILLQGGTFDHADRLFYSIEGSWNSASRDNGADVRELIPEFFYLPEFLTNANGYDFGERQGSGGKVDNVKLPPWAKGDPKIFITKHREALESPYVSQNLHLWIDLIFGHKQRGEAAVESMNVFHWLSYHGAKDLDNITDAQERHSTTSIIHNFGQTPHQVFSRPHPPRENVRFPTRRLDTSSQALSRIPHSLLNSHERVASLTYSSKIDRLLCSSPFRLNLPPFYDKFAEWGYADNSIRFYFTEHRKSAGISENLHIGQLSCVCIADSKTLITAGEDCVVSVYNILTAANKSVELGHRSSLFGHKTPVTTIAVSKAFSSFVTVSTDGHAFLWDLNRLDFVRKLSNARAVECARINDVSGEIMLCSGPNVALYTLNGDLILDQNVCGGELDDFVHSCAFYEGTGNEWLESFLVFTGHKRGKVNIWKRAISKETGKWVLEHVRRLDHADARSEGQTNVEAAITCIAPMPTLVYTGDDDGGVYEWNLIQKER